MLPHAGQIYRYAEAEAVFVGLEAAFSVDFFHRFNYRFSGEYIYTYNCDEHIPLSFSPPASMRNVLNGGRINLPFMQSGKPLPLKIG